MDLQLTVGMVDVVVVVLLAIMAITTIAMGVVVGVVDMAEVVVDMTITMEEDMGEVMDM